MKRKEIFAALLKKTDVAANLNDKDADVHEFEEQMLDFITFFNLKNK